VAVYGGIETGGTKWKCAIGTGPENVHAAETFPTTTPEETIARAVDFFEREGPVRALGIGSFGPVDLRTGYVTTTPKPGWASTPLALELRDRLGVPVAFETDVNAAALGEHRWGAAQGLDTFVYLTIGTGIGGGVIAGGTLVHGLSHPEFGHLVVPHDLDADPFPGFCPYHGDCWEGLAAGPAIEARWGRPGEELLDVPEVWELEAHYVALGLVSVIAILSPERIVIGGGVGTAAPLLPLVRGVVDDLLNGYMCAPDLVLPALGERAGVLGAIALAQAL